jgi:hypothetical protein
MGGEGMAQDTDASASSGPNPTIPTPAALRRRGSAPAPALSASPSLAFGRVDPDGTVYLTAPEGEVVVGQYAAGSPEKGLAFFARKYDDLVVEIDLVTIRLADGRAKPDHARAVIERVRAGLAERSFVGDVEALQRKVDLAEVELQAATTRQAEHREKLKDEAKAAREALATEAEGLADSTAWKATTERFAAIVDEWKALPRSDRSLEQELWKRLSAARAAFDKRRRAHFAELDVQRKEALAVKKDLIAQAEKLAQSTDWAATTRALKKLMDEWKRAPRGSRSDEDRLWKKFKAAQDSFYSAMKAADAAKDEKLAPNVEAKEALVIKAEALVPLPADADLSAIKKQLRAIQDQWDKAGDLPRAHRARLENRLKKVEDVVRKAESNAWDKDDPEKRARAESTANAFTDALARQEAELAQAQARGDDRAVRKLSESIENTRALLEAAQRIAR